jgi:hypothetical protein
LKYEVATSFFTVPLERSDLINHKTEPSFSYNAQMTEPSKETWFWLLANACIIEIAFKMRFKILKNWTKNPRCTSKDSMFIHQSFVEKKYFLWHVLKRQKYVT